MTKKKKKQTGKALKAINQKDITSKAKTTKSFVKDGEQLIVITFRNNPLESQLSKPINDRADKKGGS